MSVWTQWGRISVSGGATLALLVFNCGSGAAQASSDEGAPFLVLPVGAGIVGIGRAATAMPNVEAAFWNPAGLGSLGASQFVTLRSDYQVGTSTAFSAVSVRPGLGAVAASYLLLDVGEQDYRDEDGNRVGSISIRNHLGIVSASASILPNVYAGVNFKIIRASLSCRGMCSGFGSSSSTFALDLGAQARLTRVPMRLGVMVAHLGPPFQLKNASQADPLPTRIRLGAAYDILHTLAMPGLEGWISIEVQDRPGRAYGTSFSFGTELRAGGSEAVILRAGYAGDARHSGGVSVGVGLRLDRFDISATKVLESTGLGETDPLNVSFAIRL